MYMVLIYYVMYMTDTHAYIHVPLLTFVASVSAPLGGDNPRHTAAWSSSVPFRSWQKIVAATCSSVSPSSFHLKECPDFWLILRFLHVTGNLPSPDNAANLVKLPSCNLADLRVTCPQPRTESKARRSTLETYCRKDATRHKLERLEMGKLWGTLVGSAQLLPPHP